MSISTTSIVVTDEWFAKVVANAEKRLLKSHIRLNARQRNSSGQHGDKLGKPVSDVGAKQSDERNQRMM